MHIKKQKMPTSWPLPKKPSRKRFIAKPSHAATKSITLLALLRDMLHVAQTRKEVQKILYQKDVQVNNIARVDDAYPVQVFDTISLAKAKKHYRLEIVNKKFTLREITEKEAQTKIVKIIKKTILAKGKIQMNLDDGVNMLTTETFKVGDSAIINTKDKKVTSILPLQKNAKVEIIQGKHAGEKGVIANISELRRTKEYIIKLDEKEVRLPYKTILVIG